MAGVFGLRDVRTEQIDRRWNESNNYGYFVGGGSPRVCTIDRLDFSNETTSLPSAQLTQARSGLAAVSSSNYGYFGGGYIGSSTYVCTIDRLDFSNETIKIPSPTARLSFGKTDLAAVSSSNYGFFGGGFVGAYPIGPYVCTIDRLDFSSETTSQLTAQLTQARYNLAATSNSNFGYFGGGFSTTNVCTIDRLDFSNNTIKIPAAAQLTQARQRSAGVSNSNYGYFGGGYVFVGPAGPNVHLSNIARLDFSNETTSVLSGRLNTPATRSNLAAVSNSNFGYFGGGYNGSINVCIIDRLDFSNETITSAASLTARLTQARSGLAAVSGGKQRNSRGVRKGSDVLGRGISSTYGYFGGSRGPAPDNPAGCTIDRLDFSNETTALLTAQLTQARRLLAAVSNSNYGYFGGGLNASSAIVCTIDRLDFTNETIKIPSPTARLTQVRSALAAVSNSNYGYFGGGYSSTYVCIIDRLDFSNETIKIPSPTARLTQAREGLAAVSNSNYGYFGGGLFGSYVCTIDRLDFSNETTSLPSARLTQARRYLAAVSNSNYGYFAGGTISDGSSVCTIDRLDFSNETIKIPSPTARLTQAREGLAAVSNSNYGYFGGGYISPINVCTIDRLDFSNETIRIPAAAQLTRPRVYLAAVRN